MGYRLASLVKKHSCATGSARMVLLLIADYIPDRYLDEESGLSCHVSQDTLCADAKMRRRNLQYILKKLKASSELHIRYGGGRHNVNTYTLTLPLKGAKECIFSEEERVQSGVNKGAIQRRERVQATVNKVQSVAPQQQIEPVRGTKTHTHLRTVGAPAVVVGVNSKFSLEDCRRYAEYLHASGQGVKNPGGFAQAIYRSGSEDSRIATWLAAHELERAPSDEIKTGNSTGDDANLKKRCDSSCQLCFGTNREHVKDSHGKLSVRFDRPCRGVDGPSSQFKVAATG